MPHAWLTKPYVSRLSRAPIVPRSPARMPSSRSPWPFPDPSTSLPPARARPAGGGRADCHDRTAQVSGAPTLANGFPPLPLPSRPRPCGIAVNETAGSAAGSGAGGAIRAVGSRCRGVSSNAAEIGQVTGKSDRHRTDISHKSDSQATGRTRQKWPISAAMCGWRGAGDRCWRRRFG